MSLPLHLPNSITNEQVMHPYDCKHKCSKIYKIIPRPNGYKNKGRYCNRCEKMFVTDDLRCKCCGCKLRVKPRQ